ncbi:MAG: hypothetical protein RLP09_17400 [Sandaracinaceae bacterium]
MNDTSLRAALLSATLAVGCGGSPGPVAATPGAETVACDAPPVELRFDWPERLSAVVVGTDVTESANADGSAPMRGESRSELRMRTERVEGGVAVRFDVRGETRTRSQGFGPDIAGVRPTVLLGPDGAVRGISGASLMRARVAELQAAGHLDASAAAGIAPNLTDAAQVDTARSHWRWVTGVWHGRALRCGEVVRGHAEVPAMGLGAAPLAAEMTLTYQGATPCPSVPDRACVILRADLSADARQAAAEIEARTQDSGVRLVGGTIERKIRLIAEPDTLIPHRVTFEERQQLTWEHAGGRTTRNVRDVQDYELDYATRTTTHLVIGQGGGFAVLGEDGQPLQLPPTPACRRLTACCRAAAAQSSTIATMCAMATATVGEDCDDELEMVVTTVRGSGAEPPAECAPPE